MTPPPIVKWSPRPAEHHLPASARVWVRSVPLQAGAIGSRPECHAVVQRIPSHAARGPKYAPLSVPLILHLRAHGYGVKYRRRQEDRQDTLPYRLTVGSRKGLPHRATRWNAFGCAASYGRAYRHG